MFRTRLLARFMIPVLVASTWQTLVAGEPVGATPPAKSIHEWKSQQAATPSGNAAGPANSIHEWKSTPTPTPAASAAATPCMNPGATPDVSPAAPQSPITISLTSTLRQGALVVMLDDVPIFNEKFQKPVLLISQTTRWDPLQVASGKHRLSAKVYGTKKTYLSATYDFDVSRTKASALHFVMQGEKLTVELAS